MQNCLSGSSVFTQVQLFLLSHFAEDIFLCVYVAVGAGFSTACFSTVFLAISTFAAITTHELEEVLYIDYTYSESLSVLVFCNSRAFGDAKHINLEAQFLLEELALRDMKFKLGNLLKCKGVLEAESGLMYDAWPHYKHNCA
ncbi:uncharacterized protein AAGF69_006158 [Amazona ochrocephala]